MFSHMTRFYSSFWLSNNPCIPQLIHSSLDTHFEKIPINGIAQSYGISVFNFWENSILGGYKLRYYPTIHPNV